MIERLLAAERALAEGRLDQAERLFRQVAEADERNAIAVVGLAEVALARGDRSGAEALASQALEIDPDDAAAARLIAGRPPVEVAIAEPEAAGPAIERSEVEVSAAEKSAAEVSEAEVSAAEKPDARPEVRPSLVARFRAWLARVVGRAS